MSSEPQKITIAYDPIRLSGKLECIDSGRSSVWDRLKAKALALPSPGIVSDERIELAWPDVLGILREYGTKESQQALNFRFVPVAEAKERIQQFMLEVRAARAARGTLTAKLTEDVILSRLREKGFTRVLKPFQLRDLQRLLALPHGANFSVPGAGKTTVTMALHLLTRSPGQHLLVVAPKAAFPAWRSIVAECMDTDISPADAEEFTVIDGTAEDIDRSFCSSGRSRFIMSYDLMVRNQTVIGAYCARQSVHLVLDESHRMKAGLGSQRGAFLLSIANLPSRRDILSGTPMPQGAEDLASQLGFLWPGLGLDAQIRQGSAPREVLGQLYVRTTKQELGLRKPRRTFHQVEMAPGQMALYAIVRDEALRQLSASLNASTVGLNILGARRSVLRLLQLSVNPMLALQSMAGETVGLNSGIVEAVLNEGPSPKMQRVAAHARELAAAGKKTVLWTIFTDTISELERMLADLNPVSLHGAVPTGDAQDEGTREGRLERFHRDGSCHVMIANPAAAGEGISLHTVCHDAIYVDRSYVSTHYLQSIDRIHRLGLPPGTETNIFIYQTKAPQGLGSIDLSVSRRLATKLRSLQQLLNDPDLHEVAIDEENADDPVDYTIDLQDLVDLVEELEGRGKVEEEGDL